jgi:hypothetical protein
MHARTTPRRAEHAGSAWYRQPVAWLGALLFAASLGGCVLMIVLGARHADDALPTGGELMKMPLGEAPPAAPAPAPMP